ncbi:hypothetical protein BpHYR1_026719, partial [Brachionus plicatilis]
KCKRLKLSSIKQGKENILQLGGINHTTEMQDCIFLLGLLLSYEFLVNLRLDGGVVLGKYPFSVLILNV